MANNIVSAVQQTPTVIIAQLPWATKFGPLSNVSWGVFASVGNRNKDYIHD